MDMMNEHTLEPSASLCISGTQIYYGIQLQLASTGWANVP